MPLTTVARGRVFDWSHAVGRGAARGTGFNYIQTMALGKNGVLYTTNRGNEAWQSLQTWTANAEFVVGQIAVTAFDGRLHAPVSAFDLGRQDPLPD